MTKYLTAGACSLWRSIGHETSCLGLRFRRHSVALCRACHLSLTHDGMPNDRIAPGSERAAWALYLTFLTVVLLTWLVLR